MEHESPSKAGSCIYFFAIAGLFLIMAWLVSYMNDKTDPGQIGKDRAVERAQILKDLRQAEELELVKYGWVKSSAEGIVQVPVERAMELVEQEWQNPEKARNELIARAEKLAGPAAGVTNPAEENPAATPAK